MINELQTTPIFETPKEKVITLPLLKNGTQNPISERKTVFYNKYNQKSTENLELTDIQTDFENFQRNSINQDPIISPF